MEEKEQNHFAVVFFEVSGLFASFHPSFEIHSVNVR